MHFCISFPKEVRISDFGSTGRASSGHALHVCAAARPRASCPCHWGGRLLCCGAGVRWALGQTRPGLGAWVARPRARPLLDVKWGEKKEVSLLSTGSARACACRGYVICAACAGAGAVVRPWWWWRWVMRDTWCCVAAVGCVAVLCVLWCVVCGVWCVWCVICAM
jgi:hypothetical protein